MHQFDLKNKTAIITGGAQGFGLDIAKKFLSSGSKVFIWDIDEKELLKATKEVNNSNLNYNVVDVSNFDQVQKTVSEVILKNKMNFKNKKILVTGATGGIGDSIVKKFLSLDASVLGTGTNNEKLEALKKNYPKIETAKFDISEHEKIDEFIENVFSKLGGLDILINNAGITKDNLSLRMKNDEWQKIIDINLSSTFYLCKSAIKKMLKNKYGRIVNITSIVGHTGNIGQANYSASKAGVVAMSKSLAIEYAKKNISVNCVSPGFIQTKMTEKISEEMKNTLLSRIPMNKLGTADDVSNTVAFLCSESSSYITGETIHVNGGMYMA